MTTTQQYSGQLKHILHHVLEASAGDLSPSLGYGSGGILLFLAYYSRLFPSNAITDQLNTLAANTFIRCESLKESLKDSYLRGAAGTVVVFENLAGNQILDAGVHEVFSDVDAAVYGKIINPDLQDLDLTIDKGLLGQGLYMYARVINQLASPKTINSLQKMAALVNVVDHIGMRAAASGPADRKGLNELTACLPLLQRVARAKIYPVVGDQVVNTITLLMAPYHLNGKNRRLSFDFAYQLYMINRRHRILRPDLVKIREYSNCRPVNSLFNNIANIQRLNRLYWLTGEKDFNMNAAHLIEETIKTLAEDAPAGKPGLIGLSGLALCMISYLDKESLAWDETFAIT